MKRELSFWYITLARGFVALIAGSAVLVVPDMARSLLLLPLALTAAILGLAAYGIVDSVLILSSSYEVSSPRGRVALRLQGLAGVVLGVLLLSIWFERVRLAWFLSLATLQALSFAAGEIAAAKRQRQHALSMWNYAAGGAAACFACVCLVARVAFAERLTYSAVSRLIYSYLLLLGCVQCVTAARVIYAKYKVQTGPRLHPAQGSPELIGTWAKTRAMGVKRP